MSRYIFGSVSSQSFKLLHVLCKFGMKMSHSQQLNEKTSVNVPLVCQEIPVDYVKNESLCKALSTSVGGEQLLLHSN